MLLSKFASLDEFKPNTITTNFQHYALLQVPEMLLQFVFFVFKLVKLMLYEKLDQHQRDEF